MSWQVLGFDKKMQLGWLLCVENFVNEDEEI
jgi:hypothetical protein